MLLNTFKHFLLGPGHKQPLSLLKEKITFGSITRSQQPKQAEQEQTDVSPQLCIPDLNFKSYQTISQVRSCSQTRDAHQYINIQNYQNTSEEL